MIISRTPLRISFFGGGTDYPAYFKDGREGAILGTTIDKYVYISVNRLSGFFDHVIRVTYSRAELVKDVAEIQHPSARECLTFFGIRSNIEIHHQSDLPARTGLGSSSSFTVGLLHALYAYQGKMVRKERLAREAIDIEQNRIGERVGCQDQYLASLGGLNTITFRSDGTTIEPVAVDAKRKRDIESSLMLFYTGVTRHAHEIAKDQLERTARRDNDAALGRMREMVRQGLQALTAGSLSDFGALLHEGWLQKKSLAPNVTTPLIDELYDAAKKNGAWGGKIAGAGGGGFLLLCAPADRRAGIKKALERGSVQEVPFRFENEGSRIIYYNPQEFAG